MRTDRYNNALSALGTALDTLDHAFTGLTKVIGDDGQPLIEARGVEPRLTDPWRRLLARIDEEMVIWARTFRKAYGVKPPVSAEGEDAEEPEDADPYAQAEDDDWDRAETAAERDVAA